ncbi:MAG: threonine-phosphate decarboxylase [Acidimicrobiales bacterium]|nr:MAG: threonine-phosphate decarboxylase [Acidimicrobiales bacterium]
MNRRTQGVETVPPAGDHGDDLLRVAAALGRPPEDFLDLAVSCNPVAADMTGLLVRHAAAIRRYPDPAPLREAFSTMLGVEPDMLLFTNGASEAIALLAATLGPGRVEEPEFGLFPRGGDASAPRWISDPNNPTGLLAPPDREADVRDESFWPLATGTWTRGDARIATVGSFTKLFACPGLRLGYVVADAELVRELGARQPRWSVSSLAIACVTEALTRVDVPSQASRVAELRRELSALFESHGLHPRPSDACWILVDVGDAARFRAELALRGVLVRDCTSFGMPETVRVAVPRLEGLKRLDEVLRELRWEAR